MALLNLATEAGESMQKEISKNIQDLSEMLAQSSELLSLVQSRVVDMEMQREALKTLLEAAKFNKTLVNFVRLLTSNRRAVLLPEIISVFQHLEAEERGIISVQITSATKLETKQETELKNVLQQKFGKGIQTHSVIDTDILGGIIVKIGNQMIDGSIKTKLNSLKQSMDEAS